MKKSKLLVVGSLILGGLAIVSGCASRASKRSEIVVISDIHMGVDPSYAEINKNKDSLVAFLQEIRQSKTTAQLIINGDLIDQWYLPMDYVMPDSIGKFHDLIVQNNQAIFDQINAIISDEKIKVTYIPGNHDINFDEGETKRLFPGINQARDTKGLGTYLTGDNDIAIEHGHRYNIFVSPDPLSNRDKVNDQEAILPCGYFFTRIASSSGIEGKPQTDKVFKKLTLASDDQTQAAYYSLFKVWEKLMTTFPVSERFDDQVIKTNIDAYAGTYAINDLIPDQDAKGQIAVDLYDGMVENWPERQALNQVKAPVSVQEAILGAAATDYNDLQATTQYFDIDPTIKLVVFGHTHEARILKMTNGQGEDVLYANSGTWVDKWYDFPTRTYLVIKPTDEKVNVTLYHYQEDKTSKVLSQETISR